MKINVYSIYLNIIDKNVITFIFYDNSPINLKDSFIRIGGSTHNWKSVGSTSGGYDPPYSPDVAPVLSVFITRTFHKYFYLIIIIIIVSSNYS